MLEGLRVADFDNGRNYVANDFHAFKATQRHGIGSYENGGIPRLRFATLGMADVGKPIRLRTALLQPAGPACSAR